MGIAITITGRNRETARLDDLKSTAYKDNNVNETVYRSGLSDTALSSPDNRTGTGIIEEDQPDSFNIKVNFGTDSSSVSPIIDTQQMNTVFVQNRVDNLEINPLSQDQSILDSLTKYAFIFRVLYMDLLIINYMI